ncbi:MAG: hypothetical protein OXQ84_08435, partial [bacterium]|nr:hypothetical protein [bacterium]
NPQNQNVTNSSKAIPLGELTTTVHNNKVVLMIPDLDPNTGYLPPGIHRTSWCDVVGRFGGNSHRERLVEALLSACRSLAAAGCTELLLDGSFVTAKALPEDYDAAWETAGVDPDRLDPVLLDVKHPRTAMKER